MTDPTPPPPTPAPDDTAVTALADQLHQFVCLAHWQLHDDTFTVALETPQLLVDPDHTTLDQLRARYILKGIATATTLTLQPTPPAPVALPNLHDYDRTITCTCGHTLRYENNRTTWEGQHGSGTEITGSVRTCPHCGATLTITTRTPS